MLSALDIRIQKLFLLTVILKVGSAFLGWQFQLQWIFGFWLPLAFMAAYIALGLKRRDRDVTDEKFADSCYFLGFIFTIASIIFSLLDLPNIGTRIQDIAVRFGAAMVTTCAGLVVRVYLVTFKRDLGDAIKDVEDSAINASQKLCEQLNFACEKLCDFQSEVDSAAKATVEQVKMQIEKLSKDHAEKLTSFFSELAIRNQKVFAEALNEVKSASVRLSDSLDGYSHNMKANLESIEAKVAAFGEAIAKRLRTTTFPDDYFAKHLAPPLDQLKDAAKNVSHSMLQVSEEVAQSTTALSGSLRKLKTKATATENSLETVIRLSTQQQALFDASQGQISTLEKLGEALSRFDALLNNTVDCLNSINSTNSKLTDRVEAVVIESAEARKHIESSLTGVSAKLSENVAATAEARKHIESSLTGVSAKLSENVAATDALRARIDNTTDTSHEVATFLATSVSATKEVAEKLDSIVSDNVKSANALSLIGESTTNAISKIDAAVDRLQLIVGQLPEQHSSGLGKTRGWWPFSSLKPPTPGA